MATIRTAASPAADRSKSTSRLLSLDLMRGLTIVCMIIVNNGGGPENYSQLEHSEWNGITVCDLVFPFFLFIMGVTTYLSLSRRHFAADRSTYRKILRRTLLILLIGWGIHWFANICAGKGILDFGHLRLTGVLTRIALCYGAVSLMALKMSRRAMAVSAVILLAAYGVLLLLFNGYINGQENINTVIDRLLLPEGMLYTRRPVDPEGLLGTIPAIAHTIIGFCCGAVLASREPLEKRLLRLFVCASLLAAAGFILSGILPCNKRIWSPSYTLVTCGLAAATLATISWFTDERGLRHGTAFFESFGVNPLFLYVVADIAGIVIGSSGIKDEIYSFLLSTVHIPKLASAIYAVGLMLAVGAAGLPLYRHRIYIKI